MKVYPRVCGGTSSRRRRPFPPAWWGLSPRVRGNRRKSNTIGRWLRSIPACAGEPMTWAGWTGVRRVYPRVCGGTDDLGGLDWSQTGLSPRVRGNQSRGCAAGVLCRSIPACAGEPVAAAAPFRRPGGVYPRVCGGTSSRSCCSSIAVGLSPRVRGNRRRPLPIAGTLWSIPACAGEPHLLNQFYRVPEVYPRVCGGTSGPPASGRGVLGLSPRVRGNQWSTGVRSGCVRSIPACAGEPRPSVAHPNH